jgi:hypothetical protein
MSSNYYFRGSLLGLILVPAVAFFMIGKASLALLNDAHFFFPIFAGYLSVIWFARYADRRWPRGISLHRTAGVLVGAFLTGVLVGCLVNFLVNGKPLGSPFGFWNESWNWFGKPALALLYFGLPCAVFLSAAYYGIWRFFFRSRAF